VGLPCSSTNVSAMHAIPAEKSPRQPPSAQPRVHPYKLCLQPATLHPGPSCHHLGCTMPRGRQGPQEGTQPGEQRLAVPVGSQGKKHGVWHRCLHHAENLCPAESQQLLPCPAGPSWFVQPHMQGESISICSRRAFMQRDPGWGSPSLCS